MRQIFKIGKSSRVPDGTLVSPFLNPWDSTSGLPPGLPDGFGIAAGTIEPKSASKIQMLPFVTQVTFVYSGTLIVRLKGRTDQDCIALAVQCREAVLTEPGTLFQLVNEGGEPCKVLYITSPAYLFEMHDGKVVYDDTVVLDQDWETLRRAGWRTSNPLPTKGQRAAAKRRLGLE